MILISFEHLQKILIFPKFQGCNSKIGSATPFWILKFKWAWQTQFLSHNLVTLKNYVFFKDLQMILVPFFHIPTGFQLRKNGFKSSVHILRCPWIMPQTKKYDIWMKNFNKHHHLRLWKNIYFPPTK